MSRGEAWADVEGFEDLDAALKELPKATHRNVIARVFRALLTPIKEDAQRLAPDDPATSAPNDLKSSIIIGTRQRGGGRWGKLAARIPGVQMFMGPSTDGYPQALVQEFGADPHFVSKNAGRKRVALTLVAAGRKKHPGHAAQPYMRPAWDKHSGGLLDKLRDALWREIERAIERFARKAARRAGNGG